MRKSNLDEYLIVRDINIRGDVIRKGGKLQFVYPLGDTIPTVYMDGGLMPPVYQDYFIYLANTEKREGWHYLKMMQSRGNV